MKGVRSVSGLNFFACVCPVVLAPFVEDAVFTALHCLAPLSNVS